MRAAVALIPDRAISHRAPSLGRSPGTRHGRPDGEPVDDGRDPHPLGHRAGRPAGGRAAPAAGLRRAAQAGRPEAGPREARPDAPGDRPGPRGLPPAGGRRSGPGTGTAAATSSPPPPRPCAASSSSAPGDKRRQKRGGGRRRVDLDRARSSPTRPRTSSSSPSTRPCRSWPAGTAPVRRAGQAALLRRPDPGGGRRRRSGSPGGPPTGTGPSPAPGSTDALAAGRPAGAVPKKSPVAGTYRRRNVALSSWRPHGGGDPMDDAES